MLDKNAPMSGKLPFDPSFFSEIKLGKGVAGKASSLAAVLATGLIVASCILFAQGQILAGLALLLIATAVVVYVVERVLRFSERNPGIALLEGAHLLKYEEMQKASRETIVINGDVEPTANSYPPISLPRGED